MGAIGCCRILRACSCLSFIAQQTLPRPLKSRRDRPGCRDTTLVRHCDHGLVEAGEPARRGGCCPICPALALRVRLEVVRLEKSEDAVTVKPGEERRRSGPMGCQLPRLIDDDVFEMPFGQDVARALAASARIELIAIEIEQHHPPAPPPRAPRLDLGRL